MVRLLSFQQSGACDVRDEGHSDAARVASAVRSHRRLLRDNRVAVGQPGFLGRGHLALGKLFGAQPGRLAVIGTRLVSGGPLAGTMTA